MTAHDWITLLSIALGGTFLKITQMWFKERKAKREGYHSDGIAFRQNLINRINKLEKQVHKDSTKILHLTKINAQLEIELKNLKKYNDRLLKIIEDYERQKKS